jgi:hypothetical protein
MLTFNSIGRYGRLGNQMFQYATLLSVAKTKSYEYGIPKCNSNENEYYKFFLPECFPNLSALDSSKIFNPYKIIEQNFCYDSKIFQIYDNTDLLGYFQSEKYFLNHRSQILNEFSFDRIIFEKSSVLRALEQEDVISLHLRLGDYVDQPNNHPVCSKDYYLQALEEIPKHKTIFVFSDEIEKAKNFFNFLHRKVIFVDETNKYINMCLMTLCNYHIIANSSFSWWGAWLSNSKKVIAPKQWFGDAKHMPRDWSDIYCKGWQVI